MSAFNIVFCMKNVFIGRLVKETVEFLHTASTSTSCALSNRNKNGRKTINEYEELKQKSKL